MRTISRLLALILLAPLLPAQQGGEDYGFIRLVNAVAPGEGRLELLLDGNNLYPDGYRLGDATGGMGVPTGRCEVVVRKEGTKEGTTSIKVEAGETTTIIPFAERIPATDDEPEHWQIRILRLKQKEETERRDATFVSVSRDPELMVEMREPEGRWEKIFVKRFDTAMTQMKYPEGYVPLRLGDRELPSIPVMDVGNYVVVLYDDPEGVVRAISFRDYHHVTAD